MPYTISKTFRFEAAHRLGHLPEGHKCARPHGHSYKVELILVGPLDERGFVIDYGELDPFKRWIDDLWDHRDLETLPYFEKPDGTRWPTTAEMICSVMFVEIKNRWPKLPLVGVRVYETASTYAEYRL